MNIYLQHLQYSYSSIDKKYFEDKVLHDNISEPIPQAIERVVQAELYHQWRSIIDTFENQKEASPYHGLILHSEIGKQLSVDGEKQHPDLVLHGGQTGPNRLINKVLVELKMNLFSVNDVEKIEYAINSYLKYEYCVYIIHAFTPEKFASTFMKECPKVRTLGKQIYFMNYESKLLSLNSLLK